MDLLNVINSLLSLNAIPQDDRNLLEEMQQKIQTTSEYSKEEYRQVMDIFCKYSLC